MKGHGVTVAGTSVEDATIRAIKLESLAKVHWELAKAGKTAQDIPWQDVEEFARRPRGMGMPRATEWLWKYYVKALEEGGQLPTTSTWTCGMSRRTSEQLAAALQTPSRRREGRA